MPGRIYTGIGHGVFDLAIRKGLPLVDAAAVAATMAPSVGQPGGGDEPIFQGGDSSKLFDDFEVFADTADLLTFQSHFSGRWDDFGEVGNLSLQTGDGNKRFRATYTPGNSFLGIESGFNPGSFYSPGDEMIVTWDFTIMDGYEWAPNSDGGGNKIFLFINNPGTGRIDFIIGSEPLVVGGTPRDWYSGWNARHYTVNTSGGNNFQQNMNFGLNPDTTNDGVTRRVTWAVRFPTSGGAGDGRVRMWVAGTQVMEYDGADNTRPEFGLINLPSASSMAGIFHFPANRNTGVSSGSHWLEYDNVRIWEQV